MTGRIKTVEQKAQAADSSFIELFTPKLLTILREGYGLAQFRADVIAGLTVAIVALPLSIAIAIASGATPAQGLYSAIIGGFFVSALGGSRFQIGGPAGAFIVVVAATIAEHGMDGLLLAMLMSGVILTVMGFLQLGTYIKFIPYPVTVGFTAGIAIIIFSSQLINMMGLSLNAPESGALIPKLIAIGASLSTINPAAALLCLATIAFLVGLKKWRPNWPAMLLAVILASLAVFIFSLDVVTIGSQFGSMPSSLPMPSLPPINFERLVALLPAAITFSLLGAIESLLSAVVADGMSGRRHRSNCELVGQGVANIVTSLFQGICVTGTIARTATNVRSGAHGPIAGIMHALFLLLFILMGAGLISYIPLACLAAILAVVSWNMVDKAAISVLLRASIGDATVLLTTLGLTIFWGLAEAILVGFGLGALLFIHRMSKQTQIVTHIPFVGEDKGDGMSDRTLYQPERQSRQIIVYRISGVFFFGASASIGAVLERIGGNARILVIDFTQVPFLDATGANVIESLAIKARKLGIKLIISGASRVVKRDMITHGLRKAGLIFAKDIDTALMRYRPAGNEENISESIS